MRDIERLIEAFGERGKRDHSAWKLGLLLIWGVSTISGSHGSSSP
jgi:hypothetical protein